jgi:DNA-binding CsgD family transcriptional regulator
MKVRGITVLSRKMLVTRQFGAAAWATFYDDMARAHRCYRSFITPDSLIPLPAFLAFHDELMRRFFRNNEASHVELGRQACRWALNDGPFKAFKEKQDLPGLVASLPVFHRLYFAEAATRSEAALVEGGVEFKVRDLPEWHPYFEHLIVGYITEVLEMFCANPIRAVRLRGGSGRDYAYLLRGSPAPDSGNRKAEDHDRTRRTFGLPSTISSREMDVLLLLAHGKTNDEIGAALGISGKTAQHHVARAYRRIGVSGRVGAAMWLAEHGIIGR